MTGRLFYQLTVISVIFIMAFILEIMPWPTQFYAFKPAWLILVLTYWVLALPEKISVGSSFVLGLIWDVILGSILGVHALVLSCCGYIIAKYHQIIRNLSLWQQSLFIMLLIAVVRLAVFALEYGLHRVQFNGLYLFSAVLSGLLWPWIYLLLRKIRHQIKL